LSDFYNPNKYKFQATPNDNPNYKTGKPDAATYQRVKLYLLHHFTTLGAPHIWNGEEMGMWGADDPHGRKPLWWRDLNFEPETRDNYTKKTNLKDTVGFNESHFNYYQQLIQIRKSEKALQYGQIEFKEHASIFAYSRKLNEDEILVLCNANQIAENYNLPKQSKWINLMNNQVYESASIKLEPITGLILKRIGQ
jgi:glycosidase